MRSLYACFMICFGAWFTTSPLMAQDPFAVDNVFGSSTPSLTDAIQAEPQETRWDLGTIQQASVEYVPPAVIAFDDSEKDEDEASLEERLKKLEEGWEKLDKEWTKFDDAQKKKKKDDASKPTFKINGRIHADYWEFVNQSAGIGFFEHPDNGPPVNPAFGTDPEDRFAFRRIRLEMKGDILETMLWRIQIDFNNPAVAEMKDVYLGFKELPGNHTFLIGNQKRPMGLDHLNSSRYNVFMERPFVVEAFNEDARRMGICMHGHTDAEDLIWSYGAFQLENINTDGRAIGDSRQLSINGRLGGSPWYDETSGGRGYLHWAISGMVAWPDGQALPGDTNNNAARFRTRADSRADQRWLNTGRIAGAETYEIIGIENILNVGAFQFVTEAQHNWLQRDSGREVHLMGAYFYVNYMLTGEHIPYSRKTGTIGRLKPFENFFLVDNVRGGTSTGWGAWGIAARYNYIDLTDGDVQGGIGESVTGALNWYWTPYSKVQFNCSYGELTDHAPVGGFTSGNYLIIGTRFAIEF